MNLLPNGGNIDTEAAASFFHVVVRSEVIDLVRLH